MAERRVLKPLGRKMNERGEAIHELGAEAGTEAGTEADAM
jgi:hypothetical protein